MRCSIRVLLTSCACLAALASHAAAQRYPLFGTNTAGQTPPQQEPSFAPNYQAPSHSPQGYATPSDPAQGYSAQGYSAQGYSAQGYSAQGYSAQGYPAQGYPAQGWARGYTTTSPNYVPTSPAHVPALPSRTSYPVSGPYAAAVSTPYAPVSWPRRSPGYYPPPGDSLGPDVYPASPSDAPPQLSAPHSPAPHHPHPHPPMRTLEEMPRPSAMTPYLEYGPTWPTGVGDGAYGWPAGACPTCPPAAAPVANCNPWFASLGGLFMTRDNENAYRFSYDDTNEANQLLDTRDASFDIAGGFEARFGRVIGCGDRAIEFVYWGLFPSDQQTHLYTVNTPGNILGILNWNQLDFNGATADTFVNNADVHRVRRAFEFHNAEYNIIHRNLCCGPTATRWSAGVRYFRFAEDLEFAADTVDDVFTGAADELYYSIDVDNDLIGFQLGGEGLYCLSPSWSFSARAAAGVYANFISQYSRIGGSSGVATINNGPFNNSAFDIHSRKEDVALLSELDLRMNYGFWQNWRASLGYRVLGVTGVALPTNQIYPDLRGINDVAEVDSNGSLILHGGYARVEWNF